MSIIFKVKKAIQKLLIMMFRNQMILCIINYRPRKHRVNLHWMPTCKWSNTGFIARKLDTDKQNLGDWLAVPIYEYMLRINHLDQNKDVGKTKHLYTVGSLLLKGYQDATIWGTGILNTEPEGYLWKWKSHRKLDVRCVRGPKTLKRLKENGYDTSRCLIGDPGLLMPLIYQPEEYSDKKEYSVIVHMNVRKKAIDNEILIMTDDWKKTIDEIYNSRLIISSSLHGIILAEAYGIPAILLNNVENGDMFKYQDYYLSTGRDQYPVCANVKEALEMEIPEVPDVSELQRNLLRSFPVDLWD